ncbi:polysaccharide biosynthesis C-terminal domain-containing protein [Clostridium sp. KNHs214]|uniref:oligosaccharide flippase family protein n=1 Tax=Clostridium sp. KNHs214 TaxID=1540257 RepID=UPI0005500180|nr:polysaccharide biosynthesis C-terminal domain-containing protein [Clostridium sp. KNHs214]
MSYRDNIKSNFLTQAVKIVLLFFSSIVVSRALGPEGKGYVAFLFLFFNLIFNYGSFGIVNATQYFQKRTKFKEDEVYSVNNTYLLIVWIITSIILFAVWKFGIGFKGYGAYFILSGSVYILANFSIVSLSCFYIGNERIIELNKYALAYSFIRSTSIVIFWLINQLNIYSYFTIEVVTSIIYAVFLLKNINIQFKFKLNSILLKREFIYGINGWMANIFIYLNYRVDQYLIKNIVGARELGIYAVAVSLVELVFLIPDSVTSAISARLYNIPVNSEERRSVTTKTIKYTFYLCLALSIVGMIMIPLIPLVYGKEYSGSKTICLILFFSISFVALGKVATPYFYSNGQVKVITSISFFSFLINLVLNLLLIPKFKGNGAALASSISYVFYGIMYLVYFVKNEKYKLSELISINKDEIFSILDLIKSKFKKVTK